MNQRQHNTLHMFEAVIEYLNQHFSLWTNLSILADEIDIFTGIINNINGLAQKQSDSDTTGYTSQKHSATNSLATLVYKMALRTKSYAVKTNDQVLLQSVDIPEKELGNLPEDELINRCTTIAANARKNLDALGKHKVTLADVEAVEAAIEAAKPLSGVRTVVGGQRMAATEILPAFFTQANTQLEIIDDLVEGQMSDEFADDYFIVRHINNRRGGRSKRAVPQKPA